MRWEQIAFASHRCSWRPLYPTSWTAGHATGSPWIDGSGPVAGLTLAAKAIARTRAFTKVMAFLHAPCGINARERGRLPSSLSGRTRDLYANFHRPTASKERRQRGGATVARPIPSRTKGERDDAGADIDRILEIGGRAIYEFRDRENAWGKAAGETRASYRARMRELLNELASAGYKVTR